MKSLEELVQSAAAGGELRSGMILGIRLVLLGLKSLNIDDPSAHHRSLVAIVETDRCLPDAVELVAGCRLGNRTLKFKDFGKMAATFVDLQSGRAVRIAAREEGGRTAVASTSEREQGLRQAYLSLADETLFHSQPVQVELPPQDRPGYHAPRVVCARCGEGVSFNRYVIRNGDTVCLSCDSETPFEPLA